MHFDEKSSSGSLWERRVAGHVGGAWSRGVTSNPLPSTCPGHSGSPRSRSAACLRCAFLTTPPSLILMSFLLSILPGLSNRSLIAINHLPKQMSGTMGLGRLEA